MTIGKKIESKIDFNPYHYITMLKYDMDKFSKESKHQPTRIVERSVIYTLFREELGWVKKRKVREYEF